MPRIILIRHGESEANVAGSLGDSKTKLTPLGVKQARAAGKFLSKYYNIKHIITSPFVRTVRTAELINETLAVSIEHNELIRESGNGILAGLRREDVINIPKGATIDKVLKKLETYDHIDYTMRGAAMEKIRDKFEAMTETETDAEMLARIKKMFKQIRSKKQTGDLLLVSHGGCIKMILRYLFKISDRGCGNNYGKYSNCHVSVINDDMLELQSYSKYLDDIK